MKNFVRISALLIVLSILIVACGSAPVEEATIKPVHLEPIAGTNLNNVILTADAAKRLDIQMVPVREEEMNGAQRTVIPYAAVLYESNGNTWVYINTKSLTFMRQPIVIDYIEGDLAVLSSGPSLDAVVVTVGAAELFGSESEFEEE